MLYIPPFSSGSHCRYSSVHCYYHGNDNDLKNIIFLCMWLHFRLDIWWHAIFINFQARTLLYPCFHCNYGLYFKASNLHNTHTLFSTHAHAHTQTHTRALTEMYEFEWLDYRYELLHAFWRRILMGFHGKFDTVRCLPNNLCRQSLRLVFSFMTKRPYVILAFSTNSPIMVKSSSFISLT